MINSISPGDAFDKKIAVERAHSSIDKTASKEPVDSSNISGVSAEDMRKASIQYHHLHKKKKPRPESAGDAPQNEKKIENFAKTGNNLTSITVIEEKSAIDDIKREQQDRFSVSPFEQKLLSELGPNAKLQNEWDISGLQGTIPTLTQLDELLKKVNEDKSVPWQYLVDGCYGRAHVTSEKFLDEGINTAKMYVMIDDPAVGDPSLPFPDWRLKAENKFTKGEWWYHVATLVFAQDEKTGEVDGYIIDPAVNKQRPLKASEWIKSFWSQDFPIKFDTTYADVYDPPEESYYPVPGEFSRERFDRYLPEARLTNHEYSAVLKEIKDDYYAHHPDQNPEDES